MSTYMENIYNNNENNNFQSTYDSIIHELISFKYLTPDKSRATFSESYVSNVPERKATERERARESERERERERARETERARCCLKVLS